MDGKVLFFFQEHSGALPLYERLEERVLAEIPDATVRVQKTQISFSNKYLFACASLARLRKKKDLPEPYLVVTFGLGEKLESPRIEIATEPYPNRWTHHVLISKPEEIDNELMVWIQQAAAFSAGKKPRLT